MVTSLPGQDAPSLEDQLQQFIEDPEQVMRSFGLDPSASDSFSLGPGELIQFIIVTALAILLLRAIYRGMQHPRLALEVHDDSPPTASGRAWRRYAWTPLVLLPLWYMAILTILVVAANRGGQLRPPAELIVVAAVVVGASRLLAHVNLEAAHELAKSVPLTLISLILISGQTVSVFGSVVLIVVLALESVTIVMALGVLAVADVAITAIWWWYRRADWHREQAGLRVDSAGGPALRGWRMLVRAWSSRSSGPTASAAAQVADGTDATDPESERKSA